MPTAIDQYQTVGFQANLADANAYKLIQALMTNALDKIANAIFFINEKKTAEKGLNISLAITTLDALQASLDKEKGGEIADNLFRLYQYMLENLVIANMNDDVKLLNEISGLLTTVKSGWDGIEAEAIKILDANKTKE